MSSRRPSDPAGLVRLVCRARAAAMASASAIGISARLLQTRPAWQTGSFRDEARRRGARDEMALHALRPLLERHPAMLAGGIVDLIVQNGGSGVLVRGEAAQHI